MSKKKSLGVGLKKKERKKRKEEEEENVIGDEWV